MDYKPNLTLTLDEIDSIIYTLDIRIYELQKLRDQIHSNVTDQIKYIKKIEEERKIENMENKTLKCKDCGKEFEFTVGEQKFFEEKGFGEPVRCRECRNAKKARTLNMDATPKKDLEEMLKDFQSRTVSF